MSCLDVCESTSGCRTVNFDGSNCSFHRCIIPTSPGKFVDASNTNYEKLNCADCRFSTVVTAYLTLPSPEPIISFDSAGTG